MICSKAGCKAKRNLKSNRGLCIDCDRNASMMQRRNQTLDRQSQARLQSQSSHRRLDASLSPVQEMQQQPPNNSATNQGRVLNASVPLVNVNSLRESYSDFMASGTESKILTDMYAMMLQIVSRQEEVDVLKEEVQVNTGRIEELERKVGNSSEIAERFGIIIRNLQLPDEGKSELQHVRESLHQIGASGLDVVRDVVKANRVGNTDTYVGVVKVEIISEAARKIIMINKKNLAHNRSEMIRNLIIQNMRPHSQFYSENLGRDLLRLIPGGNEVYIASNGRLRQKDNSFQNRNMNGQILNYDANSHVNRPPRVPMPVGNRAQPSTSGSFQGHQGAMVPHQHSSVQPPNSQQPQFHDKRHQNQTFPSNYSTSSNSNFGMNMNQNGNTVCAGTHPFQQLDSSSNVNATVPTMTMGAGPSNTVQPAQHYQIPANPVDIFDPLSSIVPYEIISEQQDRMECPSGSGNNSAGFQEAGFQ